MGFGGTFGEKTLSDFIVGCRLGDFFPKALAYPFTIFLRGVFLISGRGTGAVFFPRRKKVSFFFPFF